MVDHAGQDQTPPQPSPPPRHAIARRRVRRPHGWSLAGVVGLLALAVATELLLRASGFIYHYEKPVPSGLPDEAFVFMCIGDSSTQGAGAADPQTESYPAQLEHILHQRHPETDWRYVNLGASGMNSSQLARRFEGWCMLHRPDMAILLVGNNDIWNLNDSYAHVVGAGEESNWSRRLRGRLQLWGDSLRVVGLARRLGLVFGDDRTADWNPMAHTNPSWSHFGRGLKILGPVEQVEQLYLLNFRRIVRIAKKQGVELLWLDYHVGARFGETAYVGPALDEIGVDYVDLFPLFHEGDQPIAELRKEADTARRELLCADMWHPTSLGYAVFARAIYNKLVDLEKVPGPRFDVLEDLHVHRPEGAAGLHPAATAPDSHSLLIIEETHKTRIRAGLRRP